MNCRNLIVRFLCVTFMAVCIVAAGCSDDKKSKPAGNDSQKTDGQTEEMKQDSPADTSGASGTSETPADPLPVASAPPLTEYRTMPEPPAGSTVSVSCNVPGRLTLLDGAGKVLASEESDAPTAVCIVPAATDQARLVQVRFVPADGSPGTQRMLPLPAATDVTKQLIPPANANETWKLQDVAPPAEPAK